MRKIQIGLVGLGTVGSGFYDLIKSNSALMKKRSDLQFEIKAIASRSILKTKINIPEKIERYQDYRQVTRHPDIDIVIELVGGTGVAVDIMKDALEHRKHVVTANKAALASKGQRLFQLALKNQKELYYEAAIGGGIPIIKVLREGLVGNRIKDLTCIINGTSNFILSQMSDSGLSFNQALNLAQERGFAEADPKLDIDGTDAQQKTGLLGSIAYSGTVPLKNIYKEGIENIDIQDIQFGTDLGYQLKMLGFVRNRSGKQVEIRVHPTFIPADHELASVKDEFNAIFIKSDFLGPSMYYGRGAGSYATASAVMGDVYDVGMKHIWHSEYNDYPYTLETEIELLSMEAIQSRYYIRLMVMERTGVLAGLTKVFAENNISINRIQQRGEMEGHRKVKPLILETHVAIEKNMQNALKIIHQSPYIKGKPTLYRIDLL